MTSTASQPIINTDLVLLDVDAGGDKETVIGRLVNRLADAGRTHDTAGLIAAAMAREEQSATGLPGVSLPCGFSNDNLPIGFQLTGRMFDEATLLRVADAYERATDWHRRVPSL